MQNNNYDADNDGTISATERVIADDRWIRIQKNTFTGWVNLSLKKRGESIDDLQNDFSDGIKLIKLIEVLSGHTFPHINKDPKMRTQKLENVTMVLEFLTEKEKIKLINIDSTHIVDCNLKLILGLVWTLISHYAISGWGYDDGSENSNQSPKQRLMAWLNAKMVKRPIKNLTTDWNDATAIGALVDSCAPGLCPDWDRWSPKNALENTKEAMNSAEKWLNVARLIKSEEMVDPDVDEKAMMTYLSQFPNSKLHPDAPLRNKEDETDFQARRERMLENQARYGDLNDVTIIKNDFHDELISNDIIMETKRLREKYPGDNAKTSEMLRNWVNDIYDKSWAVIIVRGQFWSRYSFVPDNNIIFKIKNEIYIVFKSFA